MSDSESKPSSPSYADGVSAQPQRRPYERPQVMKKRSVSRVTLASGGGVISAGTISSTN